MDGKPLRGLGATDEWAELDEKVHMKGYTYCELCLYLDHLEWERVESVFAELDALCATPSWVDAHQLPDAVTLDGRAFSPAWKWIEVHIGGGNSWAHANAKIVHNSEYRREPTTVGGGEPSSE